MGRSHHVRGEPTGNQAGHRGIHGEGRVGVPEATRRKGVHGLSLLWDEPAEGMWDLPNSSGRQWVIRRQLGWMRGPGDSCLWIDLWGEVCGRGAGGEVVVAVGDEGRQRMHVVRVLNNRNFIRQVCWGR